MNNSIRPNDNNLKALSKLLDWLLVFYKQTALDPSKIACVILRTDIQKENELTFTSSMSGARQMVVDKRLPFEADDARQMLHNNPMFVHRWQHDRKLLVVEYDANKWFLAYLGNDGRPKFKPSEDYGLEMSDLWGILIALTKKEFKDRNFPNGQPPLFLAHVDMTGSETLTDTRGKGAFNISSKHMRPFDNELHAYLFGQINNSAMAEMYADIINNHGVFYWYWFQSTGTLINCSFKQAKDKQWLLRMDISFY